MFGVPVSPYIVAIGVAWLSAHIIKYIGALVGDRSQRPDLFRQLFISGGMPSSHAATVVAVWTVIGFRDGIDSGLFGLATLVVLIVCYDAVKVRRSSGEQGEAIQGLIKEQKSKIPVPRAARGHTPFEVIIGSIIGALLGTVVFITTL